MKPLEKKASLILSQVDHLSGELLGFAIERIMEFGARNVQVIPTVTKKNRPGHLLIIDTDQESERSIAEFLLKELKISGYHRISTTHVFHKVSFSRRKLRLSKNGKSTSFECEVKIVGEASNPLSAEMGHDSLVKAQEIIKRDLDFLIPLSELRALIELKLKGAEITLEL